MSRRLGQHFLKDPAILDRIVDALHPEPDDVVVEIGAGQGTLTRRLAPRVHQVIAIERDPALLERLAANTERVVIVAGDALTLDWMALVRSHASRLTSPVKVIGNIPYYITTPLIEKALTPPAPRVIVFLIQQEVADRLAAAPGSKTYGALSVGVQVAARVEKLFTVRAGAFEPPPEVHSAVVRLTPLARPLVDWEGQAEFRRFVTALFGLRRKQLSRALRSVTKRGRGEVERMLAELGIEARARAEVLSPQQFVELYRRHLR